MATPPPTTTAPATTTPAPTTTPPATTTPPPTTTTAPTTTPAPTTPPPTTQANFVAQDANTNDPNDGVALTTGPTVPTPSNSAERDAQRASQSAAAEARSGSAPNGASAVPQAYNVTVPHSSTSMTFGSAVGGPGASLITMGQVLVDAVGTMALQSKGDFLAQTNASMKWLSTGGISVHTQTGVEIIAGGGSAPGACGSGGPATPGDNVDPTASAQSTVNGVTAGTSIAKAGFDGVSAGLDISAGKDVGANIAGLFKAGADIVKAGASTSTEKSAKYVGAGAEAVSGLAGAISGGLKGDWGSVASGISSMAGGGGSAAAAAAKTNIKELALNNIKMVANNKISGTAPNAIDLKTANKFTIVAGLLCDFTTVTHSSFAILKWEAKSAQVKMSCSKMEWKSKVFGNVLCGATLDIKGTDGPAPTITIKSPKITVSASAKTEITGKATIQNTLTVDKETLLHDELFVQKATTFNKDLKVTGETTLKHELEVKQPVTFKASLKVKADVTSRSKFKVKGRCTLGGGF